MNVFFGLWHLDFSSELFWVVTMWQVLSVALSATEPGSVVVVDHWPSNMTLGTQVFRNEWLCR